MKSNSNFARCSFQFKEENVSMPGRRLVLFFVSRKVGFEKITQKNKFQSVLKYFRIIFTTRDKHFLFFGNY